MRAIALFSPVRTDGASVPALLLAPQVPSAEYRIGRIVTRLAPRKGLKRRPFLGLHPGFTALPCTRPSLLIGSRVVAMPLGSRIGRPRM